MTRGTKGWNGAELVKPTTMLNVDTSTIDPGLDGKTVRLSGHFENEAANMLSITRRVSQGQVTVSQEQVYERQAEP